MGLVSKLLTILEAERARWLLWAPIVQGGGVLIYFALTHEPALSWLALTPIMAALAIGGRQSRWLPLLIAATMMCLGFNAAQLSTHIHYAPQLNEPLGPVTVEGRVRSIDVVEDGGRLLLDQLRIERLPVQQTPQAVRIKINLPRAEWPQVGSKVRITGAWLNPLSSPQLPGAYDFRLYGYFNGLGGIGWMRGSITPLPADPVRLSEVPELQAEHLRQVIATQVAQDLRGDTAAITAALLNGEQTAISDAVKQDMRASGLQHILSISGLHIGLVAGLSFFLIRLALALVPFCALHWPIKKIAAVMGVLLAVGYSWLVGAQVPTVRAAVMMSIVFIAVLLDRRALSMRMIALAAGFLLLVAPYSLLTASFQMSFAAVLLMMAVYENPPAVFLRWRQRWWGHVLLYVGGIAVTSLLATLATTPFTLFHFQQVTPYGLVANMIAVPLTGFVIMPAAMVVYVTMPFGLAAGPITVMGWGVDGLIAIAEHVARWPGAMLHWPVMPVAVLGLMVSGMLWFCLWQRRWRWLALLPITAALWSVYHVALPDLIVSDNGKIWAARVADNRWVYGGARENNFIIDQWQQLLGSPDFTSAYRDSKNAESRFDCARSNCLFWPPKDNQQPVALVRDERFLQEVCARDVRLVVTPLAATNCMVPAVDGLLLAQRGATAITFQPEPLLRHTRAGAGQRPWSVGYHVNTAATDQPNGPAL